MCFQTPAWFWFVIVLVFLNTCTVAIEHYNQPEWLTECLCEYRGGWGPGYLQDQWVGLTHSCLVWWGPSRDQIISATLGYIDFLLGIGVINQTLFTEHLRYEPLQAHVVDKKVT